MNLFNGISDSRFNIDELFQGSLDISCLNKTDNSMKNIQKFFSKTLKLRNVSKKVFWNRKATHNNVLDNIM